MNLNTKRALLTLSGVLLSASNSLAVSSTDVGEAMSLNRVFSALRNSAAYRFCTEFRDFLVKVGQ